MWERRNKWGVDILVKGTLSSLSFFYDYSKTLSFPLGNREKTEIMPQTNKSYLKEEQQGEDAE